MYKLRQHVSSVRLYLFVDDTLILIPGTFQEARVLLGGIRKLFEVYGEM